MPEVATRRRTWNISAAQLDLLIASILVLLTAVAYVQVVGFEFTNYDDTAYVPENPHVRDGFSLKNIGWAFTTSETANWYPLTWLSLMLDCQIFGPRPGAHHAINALLHAANAVLLFAALRRMTGRRWPSAAVAALFAVHPLHVESVAWIAERKDVLSTLFFLLALMAYHCYAERPSVRRWSLVFLMTVLMGLLSKADARHAAVRALAARLLAASLGRKCETVARGGSSSFEKLPLMAFAIAVSIRTS